MHSTAEGLVRHVTVTRWPGAHRAPACRPADERTTPLPFQHSRGGTGPRPCPVGRSRLSSPGSITAGRRPPRHRLNRVAWPDVTPIGTRRGELGAGQLIHRDYAGGAG